MLHKSWKLFHKEGVGNHSGIWFDIWYKWCKNQPKGAGRKLKDNQKKVFGLEGAPLHDPVTIVYLIDPSVVELKHVNVEIDVGGGCSYGRTNCDVFDYLHKKKNAYVAVDIDVDKYFDIIEEEIRSY